MGGRGRRRWRRFTSRCPPRAGEPPKRSVAWDKVRLAPGVVKSVTLALDPHCRSIFNPHIDAWEVVPGDDEVQAGGSSRDLPLSKIAKVGE